MRILFHDYAGHPAPVELSRLLAARGHQVTHAFFVADSGPKGRMQRLPDDPAEFDIAPVEIGRKYSKTNYIRRRAGDIAYGKSLARLVRRMAPDIVISGNAPTEAQQIILLTCREKKAGFVYWCQDFYSIAASHFLAQKMPGPGHVIGAYYRHLERQQMRLADHIVHITADFIRQTDKWGIRRRNVSVIPNWGAIDHITPCARENSWARQQGLGAGPRMIYCGTLAKKHNPDLLVSLARKTGDKGEVVVVACGSGAQRLVRESDEIPALRCLPLQPFEMFEQVLGAADVLLAVIEPEAAAFSVPSKILSYLCAGRPIVLAAPLENLAARILLETGAGVVVDPGDRDGFAKAALAFASDKAVAGRAARAGRAYAGQSFGLQRIADRFEGVFERVLSTSANEGRFSPEFWRQTHGNSARLAEY